MPGTTEDLDKATSRANPLMRSGSYASVRPVNPSVTRPNHAETITGQNAGRHQKIVKGLIEGQREDMPPRMVPWTPKSKLVSVPTLHDVAHAAVDTTAKNGLGCDHAVGHD